MSIVGNKLAFATGGSPQHTLRSTVSITNGSQFVHLAVSRDRTTGVKKIYVNGVLKVHPKAKDRVKPGAAVFLIVKRADASGQPTGTPLAVEKLTWDKDGQPFELSEKQAMIACTQLTGDVVVIAHYDQDGDAISKQPGDVMGQIKVKVPADGVNLFLDDVLQ